MTFLENVATAAMTVTAAAMAAIAAMAWHHVRDRKLLLLASGFVLFLLKGIILSTGLFLKAAWGGRLLLISVVFDLAILASFYLASLQRSAT